MPNPNSPGRPIVLDTHVWVWLAEGDPGLRPETVAALEAAGEYSLLRITAISLWEVAMLEAHGRLRFDIPCLDWIEGALGMPGVSLVPLFPSLVVESTRLPGDAHGDPARGRRAGLGHVRV